MFSMNGHLQELLTKKMTRKEFLVYLGVIGLAVFGISSFFKSISNLNPTKNTKQFKKPVTKRPFGSGAYGV